MKSFIHTIYITSFIIPLFLILSINRNKPKGLNSLLVKKISYNILHKAKSDNLISIASKYITKDKIPKEYILSYVLVEYYSKSKIERYIEDFISETYSKLFNSCPNFSIGMCQVKINTAKQFLDYDSDFKLIQMILKDSISITIVNKYINSIAIENNILTINRSNSFKISKIFNGQIRNSYSNIIYNKIIWELYIMLINKNTQHTTMANSACLK